MKTFRVTLARAVDDKTIKKVRDIKARTANSANNKAEKMYSGNKVWAVQSIELIEA